MEDVGKNAFLLEHVHHVLLQLDKIEEAEETMMFAKRSMARHLRILAERTENPAEILSLISKCQGERFVEVLSLIKEAKREHDEKESSEQRENQK